MNVVAHPDPVRLERELLARVDAEHPRGPGRTLVVVPTRRLAEHVQCRLASVRPAWIGLEVLQQLAEKGELEKGIVAKALKKMKIDPDKPNPHTD